VIGTIGMPFRKPGRGSVCHKVGPLYVLHETSTARGSSDQEELAGQIKSSMTPVVALTRAIRFEKSCLLLEKKGITPSVGQMLRVIITLAPFANLGNVQV
jgi:hypothetical protein